MRYEIRNGFVLGFSAESDERKAVVPEGVTGIGQRAFADAALEAVSLPEGLKKIESGAFAGCTRLKELELPASVQSVSSGAFAGSTALERIRLSESMPLYGEQLFTGCAALRRAEGTDTGSWAEYEPKSAVLSLHQLGGYKGTVLAGLFVDSALLRSGTVLECRDEAGKRIWAVWLPVGEQSAELKEKLQTLLYGAAPFRFAELDELFRSLKEDKNKVMYALLRLLYPVDLNSEVEIMLRNLLRRGATPCSRALVEDGRLDYLKLGVEAGLLDRAEQAEILPLAAERDRADEVRAIFAGRTPAEKDNGVETLTPVQIKMLNSPVYARLMERKEKLRRASLERLAKNGESLEQLLREGVRADDRAKVRYYLASSGMVDGATLFECAMLAIENDDIYMLQDLIEAMHGLKPMEAGLLLEHAAIGGKTGVVRFLCTSLPEITPYNRALGYAMRQADFDMAAAILAREDQKLTTAKNVRDVYVSRLNSPAQAELERRIVDLGYIEYNYYDDDFRYMLLNTNRNGLIGDEFYETHYTLVKLAGTEERIAFIRKMHEAGFFGRKELDYLCYLAADADEIDIAEVLVQMGADFDVKTCSIEANQQTVLEELSDMFTSNPHRPSDEKFAFILSRLKPGEKMKLQVKYLLKTANVSRALAILKHSSLENVEDVPMTIDYFVRHNSLEAIELFCQWGRADECFEAARTLENTEIVAWILNYQHATGTREDIRDRFEI